MDSVANDIKDCIPITNMKQEKPEGQDKICAKQPQETQEKDAASKSTNDDVQRAIEGLKEIPDEELQEFLDDEDFMEGLDVVDAWEGDEEKHKVKVEQDTSRATNPARQEEKPPRERDRAKTTKGPSDSREKPKREERKRDELRRDPTKSSKDIERDKIRTKRDTESKLLAEKEKAIKHLLDSDNVVPPGTESEAIQNIKEEQNRERAQREGRGREHHRRRSADRYSGRQSPPRRRSPDRLRSSPHRRRSPPSPERRRSPLRNSSDKHKSPFRYSPARRKNSPRYFDRRSPIVSSPERRRSPRLPSWERRSSADRRWSPERHRRRDTHERRRSRSRDRRSRSTERLRRRSSRSPVGRRYSPRRRSRTRSRSPEKRARKRSPFIHELARQLRNEGMMPSGVVNAGGYAPPPATVEGIAPLLNAPMYQQEGEPRPPPPQSQPAPPPPLPPPSVAPFHPHQSGPLPPPPPPGGSPFMGFESMSAMPPMTFHEPMAPHSIPPVEYSSGPVMYNQPNNTAPVQQAPPQPVIHPPLLPASVAVPSPQPVPAPVMDHVQMPYKALNVPPVQVPLMHQFEATSANSKPSHAAMPAPSSQIYKERGSASYSAEFHALREERLKTPEPPVISKPKQFEKTSLSSLLEASVSAKDPSNIPMLYPGFKPEIIRYCEQALCQLPLEDPRLKMKGRFFYDRNEESGERTESVDHISNSILLQKSKTRIYWEECSTEQQVPISKAPTTQMHQKICQTDEVETETKGVQVRVATSDFESQVYPHDLDHVQVKEEKRPIMDRLDWSVRETYDYAPRYREADDLRWSLSSSSRRNYRQESPSRASEHEHLDLVDHGGSRTLRESPAHSRESFSGHRMREHYSHTRYSPDPYHRRSMERDEFHDKRSDHSRGESPMDLEEESDDELVSGFALQRGSDWHGRGKPMRGKSYNPRGKHMGGRPYRGRGGYRGKF